MLSRVPVTAVVRWLYWERRTHPADEWSRTVPTAVCVLPHDLRLPVRDLLVAELRRFVHEDLPAH